VTAATGLGAGRVHVVDSAAVPPARAVLAVGLPLAQFAPLLWRASALVSAGGSQAAHLFEVARSLGIPAALGVDLPDRAVAAVDGGVVAVLPQSAPIAEVA
jgi:pyruvate,water dikinase